MTESHFYFHLRKFANKYCWLWDYVWWNGCICRQRHFKRQSSVSCALHIFGLNFIKVRGWMKASTENDIYWVIEFSVRLGSHWNQTYGRFNLIHFRFPNLASISNSTDWHRGLSWKIIQKMHDKIQIDLLCIGIFTEFKDIKWKREKKRRKHKRMGEKVEKDKIHQLIYTNTVHNMHTYQGANFCPQIQC